MKVKDIMSNMVITVSKYDSIKTAAKKMAEFDIGMLVVTTDSNEVLGVVTDRDIVIRYIVKEIEDGTVEDAMTHHYIGIPEDEDIKKAIDIMGEYQLKRLVVTDKNNKALGVLSLSDIASTKFTNQFVNEALYEISIPNPQKEKPLKYLRVDDFPL